MQIQDFPRSRFAGSGPEAEGGGGVEQNGGGVIIPPRTLHDELRGIDPTRCVWEQAGGPAQLHRRRACRARYLP
jgi:hypothetical protein